MNRHEHQHLKSLCEQIRATDDLHEASDLIQEISKIYGGWAKAMIELVDDVGYFASTILNLGYEPGRGYGED